MSIQAIDAVSVHRLTSGQVVTDLTSVVKELLENSLDAGATVVDIRFKEHGVESIEVQDNGKGIDESDWPAVALKHHTSKLASFEGLAQVDTLGFRGEALSSLCALANVTIVTATEKTKPVGMTLEFNRAGECTVGKRVARPQGTSVIVRSIFETLPVRRKELVKHAKREFSKALELINAYALISHGVRFEVKDSVKGRGHVHLQTRLGGDLKSHFSTLFGAKDLANMLDLDLALAVQPGRRILKLAAEGENPSELQVAVKGLVSRPVAGAGRTSTSRQYFYVNRRPFFSKTIAKAFNEEYKTYLPGNYPCVVADFQLSADAYDVNVSPDKRTILLHSEENLVTALKDGLEQLFSPSKQTFAMIPIASKRSSSSSATKAGKDVSRSQPSSSPPVSSNANGDLSEETVAANDERPSKRRRTSSIDSDRIDEDDGDDRRPEDPLPLPRSRAEDVPVLNGELDADEADEEDILMVREAANPLFRRPSPTLPEEEESDLDSSDEAAPPLRVAPVQLKQTTLSASGSSWTKASNSRSATSRIAATASGSNGQRTTSRLDQAKGLLRRFLNPSQRKPTDGDEDDVPEDEGASEADELDEEADAAIADGSVDADVVVKPIDGHAKVLRAADAEQDDDEIVIEDSIGQVEIDEPETPVIEESFTIYSSQEHSKEDLDVELGGAQVMQDIEVDFDLDRLTTAWSWRAPNQPDHRAPVTNDPLQDAGVEQAPEKAEAALSRIVSKADFSNMSIIGQFNLGFIISRRSVVTPGGEKQDDLFIVDQHASDEKYNFEKLQAETVIKSQRLLIPRTLDLPSHEELVAMDHLDVLRLNGFDVSIDEELPVGNRVKLTAQPVSKSTEFGPADLEELLHLIASSGSSNKALRPSKVRRMFASRACRKSVMIGKALTHAQMSGIVRHMGEMSEPWSCPHGRPTMRWLASLTTDDVTGRQQDERADIKTILRACESLL